MRKWMGILLAAPKLPLPPWASPFPHSVRFRFILHDKRDICSHGRVYCSAPARRRVASHSWLVRGAPAWVSTGHTFANVKKCRIQFCHNKMCIFRPNPGRSWVIVARSSVSNKNGHWSVSFSSLEVRLTSPTNLKSPVWTHFAPGAGPVASVIWFNTDATVRPLRQWNVTYFGSKSTHQPLKCAQFTTLGERCQTGRAR